MLNRILLIFVLLILVGEFYAQDTIRLENPSFEDEPRAGDPSRHLPIKGWTDCGRINFPRESPPDIHPVDFWKVTKPTQDGETYLGLVVRDNDSYESVSQKLQSPLEDGKCYSFSVFMAKSDQYVSVSQRNRKPANFTKPAVLRIWGGNDSCVSKVLLGESKTVENSEWESFDFNFNPENKIEYITLEAFYKTPILYSYNGHILLDNASSIVEVDCKD